MRTERMFGILTTLLARRKVTARELAEAFEVSRRTIHRDIEAMCAAGIPIYCRQGGDGGISIAEGFKLDMRAFSREDLSDILSGLRGIASVTDGGTRAKLVNRILPVGSEGMEDGLWIDLSSHYRSSLTEKIALLRGAIRELRVVAFDYYSDRGKNRREAEPYAVLFRWSDWYLYAFSREREDFRLFKLQRMWEVTREEAQFERRNVPPDAFTRSDAFPDERIAILRVEPGLQYRIVEAFGPGAITEEADGRLRVRVHYTYEAYMVGWVLGLGGDATVLEPEGLRMRVRMEAQRILRNCE